MTTGVDIFRKRFSEYQDQYVLIGGLACDLLMDEAGIEFRPTRDFDMVLIAEALTANFVKAFWDFVEEGGYEARMKGNGKPEFYRFVNPKKIDFPYMMELFARPVNNIVISGTKHLIPIRIDDEISSLSAILLNEAYYKFLLEGRKTVDGLSLLDAEHLIPFKMKAWLDLTDNRASGIHVNDRDLRKHRQDIFRLFPLVREGVTVKAPVEVFKDIQQFIQMLDESAFEPQALGLNLNKEEVLKTYRAMYIPETSL